jgi:hypothetical protein
VIDGICENPLENGESHGSAVAEISGPGEMEPQHRAQHSWDPSPRERTARAMSWQGNAGSIQSSTGMAGARTVSVGGDAMNYAAQECPADWGMNGDLDSHEDHAET